MENFTETEPEEIEKQESLLSRLKNLIVRPPKGGVSARYIQVIVNPAAGKEPQNIKLVNAALQDAGVEWDLQVTKKAGDAFRMAKEAVRARVDTVVVYGGDGTVMEAASGLAGSDIPLGIIPGGTMNIAGQEFGIPGDLVQACALAVNPPKNYCITDLAQIGEWYFLLRAGIGFDAASVALADRKLKDRYGVLAYAIASLQVLTDPPTARYTLCLDGETVESEGVTCLVANSGTTWISGISLAPKISISDGLLDVLLIRKADLPSLVSMVAAVVTGSENPQAYLHWQVHEVTVTANPPQPVQADGEMLGKTPVTAKVIPQAVKVIVPPPSSEE